MLAELFLVPYRDSLDITAIYVHGTRTAFAPEMHDPETWSGKARQTQTGLRVGPLAQSPQKTAPNGERAIIIILRKKKKKGREAALD